MRGGGWDAAPSPCPVLPATARGPACKGFILPPPPPRNPAAGAVPGSFVHLPPAFDSLPPFRFILSRQ